MSESRSIEQAVSRIYLRYLVLPLAVALLVVISVMSRDVYIRLQMDRDRAYQFALGMIGNYVSLVVEELERAEQIGLLARADPDEAQQVLRILLNRGGRFLDLVLVETPASVVAAVHRDRVGTTERLPDFIDRDVIEAAARSAEHVVAPAAPGPGGTAAFSVAVPVTDALEGRVVRVLHARTTWREVSVALASGAPSTTRVRVAVDGRVVAGTDGWVVGSGLPPGPTGGNVIRSRLPFNLGGMDCVVIVEADRDRLLYLVMTNGAAIAAIAGALLWSSSRLRSMLHVRVVAPIKQLAGESRLVERLDSSALNLPHYDITEMDELARQLEAMVTHVGAQVQDLVAADESNRTLLREVHHRVKNNLQTIRSLIHMQREISRLPEQLDEKLAATESRVTALSIVHEHLVQQGHRYAVSLRRFVVDLVQVIAAAAAGRGLELDLRIDVEDRLVDVDVAGPIGQIVSELVTNSVRHGFEGRSSGTIEVAIRSSDRLAGPEPGSRETIMTVRDDGRGLRDDDRHGLGLQLLHLLADQLGGTARVRTENGCIVEVRFPCPQARGIGSSPPAP